MAPNNSTSQKPFNPNEELVIPQWVNEDYFQPILEQDVPNYAKIVKLTPIAAIGPGENYTSIMVRVMIDIELKDGTAMQTSYILKTSFEVKNEGTAFVDSLGLFPKEKQMYQTLLPQFMKLYREAGVDVKIGPACLRLEETPERITLVMEDLKRRNFINQDRLKGFDFPHMQRVLYKLAELHAASAVYYELNGPYDELFNLSLFNDNTRVFLEAMAKARQVIFEKAMREWGLEDVEQYIAKQPTPEEFFDEAARVNRVDPLEFNVLNHGDSWSNNIMFNYKDNGEIDEVQLVDFQVGKWASPAQDLWYFIVTSASLDIKVKEFDHFVAIYHERLIECLKLLKYSKPLPTLKELHIMMIKYGYWGPMTATGVMCAVLFPSDKDANMENMMKPGPEGDEFRYKVLMSPYYAKAMCQLYPFFNNKGILDIASTKN